MNDLLAVLAVVFLGHMLPKLGRYRDFTWYNDSLSVLAKYPAYAQSNWGLLITVGGPALVLFLLELWGHGWFWGLGHFLFSFSVLFYTWGPRDLDVDVERMMEVDVASHPELARSLFGSAAQPHDKSCWLTVTLFDAALERWFSVLFWFLLFGPVGAFVYRLVHLGAERAMMKQGTGVHQGAFLKLKYMLDWPPAHLLSLSLAVVSQFDVAFNAWRDWHRAYDSWFVFDTDFLSDVACAVMFSGFYRHAAFSDSEEARYEGILKTAMALAWRCLIFWVIIVAAVLFTRWLA